VEAIGGEVVVDVASDVFVDGADEDVELAEDVESQLVELIDLPLESRGGISRVDVGAEAVNVDWGNGGAGDLAAAEPRDRLGERDERALEIGQAERDVATSGAGGVLEAVGRTDEQCDVGLVQVDDAGSALGNVGGGAKRGIGTDNGEAVISKNRGRLLAAEEEELVAEKEDTCIRHTGNVCG